MSTDPTRIDTAIAYFGLLPYATTDAQIHETARMRGLNADALFARVAQLRAASHRLVQARIDYIALTRDDFALLKGVADIEAVYADKRSEPTEMDIFHIANRVTE